ncbi:b(0,+)-type amino acid transporter 1-like [Saccostrea echinata]|uniref:b(0,+)-type amino acid transporter 1-like n=1 Tax=Saccostrea echinata TaxID=191078 RepID=UPI002A831792|nr:b(0,+)-type amino acid transporter 1-like [Saccostrea echinata]
MESPDCRDSLVTVIPEKVRMKRNIGLIRGTSLIVGSIIGSGIFISPKGVLQRTGSVGLSLVVWTVSGFISLMGALSYAELGIILPKSGGEYIYIKEGLGDIPAFLYAWISIIVIRTSSIAVVALTFGENMATLFQYCGSPVLPIKIVAAVVIVTLGVINSYSTSLAGRTQVLFTFVKLTSLAVISIGGIVKLMQGNTSQFKNSFEGTTSPSNVAMSFYNAVFAYGGWQNLNFVTEELKNPVKDLPRTNILGLMVTTIVYLLVNISYLTVMTSTELVNSPAVAATWGDRVLGTASVLMPLSVMFSTFGAANGALFGGGRALYAAAREGHFPEVLSYIHCKYYTPFPSIIFTIVISLFMVIPGDIGSLVDFLSFTTWLVYGMTVSCLVIFRFTKKHVERPFKVPVVIPVLFVLICIYLVIGPLIENPQIEFLYAFLSIVAGLFFYFPFVYFKVKIKGFELLTTSVQLLCEVVPCPYEPET